VARILLVSLMTTNSITQLKLWQSLLITAFSLVLCPSCLASEKWEMIRMQAQQFDYHRKFSEAAAQYERALSLLPATQENARAQMECALAVDLKEMVRPDESVIHGQKAVSIGKRLRAEHKLEPDLIVSLSTLLESCDGGGCGLDVPYSVRFQAALKFQKLGISICEFAFPNQNTIKRQTDLARIYVGLSDQASAETQLLHVLKLDNPKSKTYFVNQLRLAAVQQRLNKPQLLGQLTRDLEKSLPEPLILNQIAQAEYWAANYDAARKNLDVALSILEKHPDRKQQGMVLETYAATYLDCADGKRAEPYLRKRFALLSPTDDKHEYDYVKHELVECLRLQNRNAEADAMIGAERGSSEVGKREYMWMLTDEERAELRKLGDKGQAGANHGPNKPAVRDR
jgi:tetratricopeptide (TPR) repeat protein